MLDKYEQRARNFRELLANWPKPGKVLEGLQGEPAEITIQGPQGRRMIFTTAVIDDDCTGWYLSLQPRGVMIMIDMKNHEELLQKADLTEKPLRIDRVRVIRASQNGKALICELVEESEDDN